MPRFFFRLIDGLSAFDDLEGESYEDLDSARAGAVIYLSNLLLHRRKQLCINNEWRILVRDGKGAAVIELFFVSR